MSDEDTDKTDEIRERLENDGEHRTDTDSGGDPLLTLDGDDGEGESEGESGQASAGGDGA